jgi:peptidyl-prolyl cis-trans isomerase SurA
LRRWYYASDLSEELQGQLFSIQRLGDVTIPIRTNLGWQIFKLLDKKPLLSFEEMAEYIRQKVLTDPERMAMIRRSFMSRVRAENQVVVVEAAKKIALERFVQDRVGDEYYLKMPLVQIGSKSWTVQDFYTFIVAQQKRKLKLLGYLPSIPEAVYLEEFVDNHTMTVEEQHLETKYPAFQEQMNEFYAGSMFSKIVEREIYEPSLDTLNQQKYFTVHAAEYTLPVRVQAKIVNADSPKTLTEALQLVSQAPYLMNKRLPDISFSLGKVEISEVMNKIQQELFLLMAKNRDYVVEISGHQDASESDTLAEARVNSLVGYLKKKGIGSTRIVEKVEGNLKPVSKSDKAKNARVSFRFFSQSMEDVVKRFNAVKPMTIMAEEGMYVKGQQPLLDTMPWEVGKKTWEIDGRQIYIEISRIEPQRLMRFDESRSSVIRGLQAQLERDWLAGLKQKYPVRLDQEELNRLMQ